MNRAALKQLLEGEHVRSDAYSVDGDVRDECLCLLPEGDGWIVFYSERGGRTGTRAFESEADACDFLATRLLSDPGNRRRPGGFNAPGGTG